MPESKFGFDNFDSATRIINKKKCVLQQGYFYFDVGNTENFKQGNKIEQDDWRCCSNQVIRVV